jgi:hypothetical protein
MAAETTKLALVSRKILAPTTRGELVLRFSHIIDGTNPETLVDQLEIKSQDNAYDSDGLIIMRSLGRIHAERYYDTMPVDLPAPEDVASLSQGLAKIPIKNFR